MTVALIVAAAVALAWPWIKEHARRLDLSALEGHHYVAIVIGVAALLAYSNQATAPEPTPAPPAPNAGIDLRGTFVGADAAADAQTTAALCLELANELEWDGMQPAPLIKTGIAFDELRIRARLLLCRGESLGEKHPRARQAIEQYLNATAGTSGGPLTPESRSKWVAAYRVVGRAAEDAAR